MKHLKLFFALFAMLALGVGNAWGAGTWTLVKDASTLAAGDKVIIVAKDKKFAMSTTQNTNNRGQVEVTKNGETLTYTTAVQELTLKDGKTSGTLAFYTGSGYLYAASSSKNYLKTETKLSANSSWTITIANTGVATVKATGSNSRNWLRYNSSNNPPIFSCYVSGQGDVCLYKYVEEQGGDNEETVVSVPTFSVPEGTFYSPINVELSCETADAEIHYTLDGSTPTSTSEKYTTAIAISETTTIKAIAIKDGLTDSEVATATYTKGETVTSYDIDFETNALEAYVNWDFSNITIAKTITAKGGTYYGNTSVKASASIKTKEKIQYPGILTFSVSKESTNTTASNWLVQVSDNGTTWTTVGTISATEMTKGVWKDHSVDLSDYENVYVQISYGSSTAVRAIDEISLAQGVAPEKYTLTINAPENGTLFVKKGGEAVASGDEFKAGTSLVVTPTPATGYVFESLTVDGSAVELTEGSYTFNMPAANVTISATFKENEKPAATLTLSKNGETEDITGYKQDDKVVLPSITSDCVKEFVGWSANPTCNVAPEYAAGDSYTLTATAQTLYAVYADGEGGGSFTITKTMSEIVSDNNYTVSSGSTATCYTSLTLDENITLSTTGQANCGSFWSDPREWRLYQNKSGNAIVTATNGCILTSVKFTFTVSNTGVLLNNGSQMESNTAVAASGTAVTYTVGNSGSATNGQVRITAIEVSYSKEGEYSNYSTTCAAAPIATIDPTSVTATAAGANGEVEVTYENVNTESVAVALYNDEACTEAFTAGWLTAAFDADKNITYTVTENTTYAERKAYIKLTAPETTGATEPAVVVIPVTQAGKDKVFASLEELVAADLTAGDEVTVTLNNDVIKEFYIYSSKRCGVVFDVQKEGKDIKIYFNSQTTIVDWAVGGKLSGTLTNVKWTTYSNAWQLAPANTWAWANLTYTEPKAVSTVVVSGAPTKTTYVDGEAFDPAGLTVTVNYNDATNEVNPTGVTFAVTPATLVKGQTSVSVTATYNSVSSAAYEVTGLTVNDIPTKTVAEFIAAGGTRCYLEGIVSGLTEGNSMKYGNFDLTDASGTIYVYGCLNAVGESKKFAELGVKNGDKIKVIADEYELYEGTTKEAKNVQYVSHISAATITIENITLVEGDEHAIVAVVTPAEAEGKVTYSIKSGSEYISLAGNVITANAVGTATITATIATAADYMGTTKDFTVTVKEYVAPISGRWEHVTDASTLKAGDKVIVAQYVEEDGTIYTMGGQKTNNRDVVESSVSGTTLTPTTGTTVLSLVDAGNGTFALQVDNGKYLYAASNTSNHLKETATINDNAKWSVSITDGKASVVAQGANTHNTIRFNKSNTPKIFSCYESGQQDIALYKKMPDYTRDVRQGCYGTICLPNGGVMVGASIFEIAYKDASKIYFDEIISNEMVAGTPYIFLPSDGVDQIEVYYTNEANASAGSKNGLVGSYTQEKLEVNGNNYILLNNQYCEVIGEAYVGANRAYFQLGSIRPSAFAPAPGVHRVSMGMAGQNTATGMENVDASAQPVKTIINGQLFILRGEKMYDAQGKLVK